MNLDRIWGRKLPNKTIKKFFLEKVGKVGYRLDVR